MPWVLKDMNYLLENKFQGNESMKECNTKICMNYITTLHLNVLDKLREKRTAATVRQALMKEWQHDLKCTKVQHHSYSGNKLVAQVVI